MKNSIYELRVGLLSPTTARQLVRLPQGNQAEVLDTMRREALSGAEVKGVAGLRRPQSTAVHPGASARGVVAG
jgi:hypothetical protein